MGTHASPGEVLTEDAMFGLLSNVRRRRLIYLLSATDGSVGLGDLARQLAEMETGGALDESTYWRVYVSIYQTHIPKLERYGLVSYSDDERLVVSGEINGLMHLLEGSDEAPWLWPNLAVAATVAAVFAYYLLFLHPNEMFATGVAVTATTMLGILSLVHIGQFGFLTPLLGTVSIG